MLVMCSIGCTSHQSLILYIVAINIYNRTRSNQGTGDPLQLIIEWYLQFCRYADKGDMLSDLGECSKFLITEIITGGVLGGETSHKVIRAICIVILIVASNRLSASPNRRETGRCRFSRKEFADVVRISSWYWLWVAVSARSY